LFSSAGISPYGEETKYLTSGLFCFMITLCCSRLFCHSREGGNPESEQTGFRIKCGITDKRNISYFQVNDKKTLWNIVKKFISAFQLPLLLIEQPSLLVILLLCKGKGAVHLSEVSLIRLLHL